LFDLTTDDTAIDHPQRWDRAKSVPATLIQHAYQKTKSLSFVRTRSMDGTFKELGRFPAEAGCTLVVSIRFKPDDRTQTLSGLQIYDLCDSQGAVVEKKQLQVAFHLIHRTRFEKLAHATGFRVVRLYGDYER